MWERLTLLLQSIIKETMLNNHDGTVHKLSIHYVDNTHYFSIRDIEGNLLHIFEENILKNIFCSLDLEYIYVDSIATKEYIEQKPLLLNGIFINDQGVMSKLNYAELLKDYSHIVRVDTKGNITSLLIATTEHYNELVCKIVPMIKGKYIYHYIEYSPDLYNDVDDVLHNEEDLKTIINNIIKLFNYEEDTHHGAYETISNYIRILFEGVEARLTFDSENYRVDALSIEGKGKQMIVDFKITSGAFVSVLLYHKYSVLPAKKVKVEDMIELKSIISEFFA